MSRRNAVKSEPAASTLDKGLSVLEAVERAPQPASIQDVARATGIQRLAVYRLLTTLERRGYVARDDSKRYRSAARRRRVLTGYAAPLSGNWFRTDLADSLRAAAVGAGIELAVFENRDDDEGGALGSAERLIAAGVDVAVLFQPSESIGHMMADRLFSAHVPFITVERAIQGGVYYGANNYRAGQMAGAALARFARVEWKGRFDRVVLLESAPGSGNVQARITGVMVALREALGPIDEARVVHLDGRGRMESSREAMAALLRRIRPGSRLLVSGFNDLSAVGALHAARYAGREEDVAIVGQNAAREGRIEIRRRASRLIASVAYFPEKYGPGLVRLASDIAAGRRVPPAVYTEHVVIDRRNIGRLYPDAG